MDSTLRQQPNDVEAQSPSTPYFLNEKVPLSSPSGAIESPAALSYMDAQRQPPFVRKYSGDWWKSSWSAAISEGRWPRFLYSFVGLLLLGIWVGLTIYFAKEDLDFNSQNAQRFRASVRGGIARNYGANNPTDSTSSETSQPRDIWSLSGSLKQFDQNARKLIVEWKGIYQETLESDPQPLGGGPYPNTPFPLKIYRDISTVLYDRRANQTNTAESTRVASLYYRLDNGSMPHIGVIGAHKFDSISTEIAFSQATDDATATRQPLFSYPFDQWKGEITLVARLATVENIITAQGNYTDAAVGPLDGARLEDNSLNWRFDLSFDNTCLSSPEITKYITEHYFDPEDTEGIDWDKMTDARLQLLPVPCQTDITILATRPPLVKFGAILAVLVNWTSTIFIFILTCECLVMRRGYTMAGSDLLAVTFTALFALPSVRMLLPGAPEFGCLIDLIGIIPQVIIISLCITAIAVTKLHKDRHDRKKEE